MQVSDLSQKGTPAAFRSRVDDVFGNLHAEEGPPPWSLSQQQVFRPGKEEAFSSDEEEEAAVQDQRRQELLPGNLVDFEGDEENLGARPSEAFCRGLDREEEYDSTDHAAMLSGLAEDRPLRHTEVLDDNPYEDSRPGSTKQVAPSDQQNGGRQPQTGTQMPTLKRPRDPLGHNAAPSHPPPRQTTVPDHVRNPHKYTCYELEEPLIIGSGGGGDVSRQQPSLNAEPNEVAEPPAALESGAGKVEFRARPRAPGAQAADQAPMEGVDAQQAASGTQANARVGMAGTALAYDEEEADEGGDDDVLMQQADAVTNRQGRRPVQRRRGNVGRGARGSRQGTDDGGSD